MLYARSPVQDDAAACDRSLLRRADANRDERGIRSACLGTAGSASLTEELRLITSWPAIGGNEDLVVLTLNRAARHAVGFDDPYAWARRTLRSLFTLRTGWTGRSCWSDRTGIALGTLRPSGACIALRTFAATGQSGQQRQCECQTRCTHFQILPRDVAPATRIRRSNSVAARKDEPAPAYWRPNCFD